MNQRLPSIIVLVLALFCTLINTRGFASFAQAAPFKPTSTIQQVVPAAQTITIILPGNSGPLNTHITVAPGDIIKITASGTINNSMGAPDNRPDGQQVCNCVFSPSILPNISASSLVGSVTNSFTGIDLLDDHSDVNPQGISGASIGQPGIYGPGYIGSAFTGMAASAGEIYIAYNDNFLDDNVGSFTVNITVITLESLQYKIHLPSVYN